LRLNIRDPLARAELRKQDSRLLTLNPFVDAMGVLRAGGRLELSESRSFESKHPAILPGHDETVESLIRKEHVQQLHAGVNHTLSSLRKKFFVMGGRTTIGRVIAKCFTCQKCFKRPREQKMGPLPVGRVDVYAPFEETGMDVFGPFHVIHGGRATTKRWVLLFTCMACRAVHFEALKDMSTSTCINALARFQARRPGLRVIWCDNGTNFVGAQNELDKAVDAWNSTEMVDQLRLEGIERKFGPPNASHWGGVYERLVQSAKKHLKVLLPEEALDSDVFVTVLGGVESVMNN
jgi:hypothetical protein